jgi:hypothetical protein
MTDLPGRDPRNPAHRMAAMAILRRYGSARVTHDTEAVLRRIGVDLPTRLTVSDTPRRAERLVAAHFLFEKGLAAPDNIIGVCDGCRHALQFRPSSQGLQQKFCLFCAAEAVLREVRDKPNKRRRR